MSTLFSQNLLAVLDLTSNGSIPGKNLSLISDRISEIAKSDTSYVQFERSMLPELLQQLSVDQSATTCSDPQCLVLIGSLIGANAVIGGFIRYTNKHTEIELNFVDVATKRAINTVSLSSGAKKAVLLETEIPALVHSLLTPGTTPPPSKYVVKKRSFFTNPLLYVGTLFVGGAAAGAYYYKYYYNADDDLDVTDAASPLSLDDAPQRSRE